MMVGTDLYPGGLGMVAIGVGGAMWCMMDRYGMGISPAPLACASRWAAPKDVILKPGRNFD